jgi:hypothetical protein
MVVLAALGSFLRDLVRDMVELVGAARTDLALDPRVDGGENFESTDVMGAVAEAVELLNGVPQKSPTFMKAYLLRTYKTVMGAELTEDDIAKIRKELEDQINAEEMAFDMNTMLGPAGEFPDPDDAEEEEIDEDDGEDTERAAARAAARGETVKGKKPAAGRVYESRGR